MIPGWDPGVWNWCQDNFGIFPNSVTSLECHGSPMNPLLLLCSSGISWNPKVPEMDLDTKVWELPGAGKTARGCSQCVLLHGNFQSWNHGVVWGGRFQSHPIPWARTAPTIPGCSKLLENFQGWGSPWESSGIWLGPSTSRRAWNSASKGNLWSERGWKIGICIPQESWTTCPFPDLVSPSGKIFLDFLLLSCIWSLEFCRPPGHRENLFPFLIFPFGNSKISLARPLPSTKNNSKSSQLLLQLGFSWKIAGSEESKGPAELGSGRISECRECEAEPGSCWKQDTTAPGAKLEKSQDVTGREEIRENPISSTNQP